MVTEPNAKICQDAVRSALAEGATLRRSFGLLRAFRFESSDPDQFYDPLAQDWLRILLAAWRAWRPEAELSALRALDVGGAEGRSAVLLADIVERSVLVDADPDGCREALASGVPVVRGDGQRLPFADATFDLVASSNVGEHVPQPWRLADELLRVTRPGGMAVFSYTVWLGPFGGHETGRWHWLGGRYAARRYARAHGRPPKNLFGVSLFAVSAADGLRWARRLPPGAVLLAALPRYHPRWAWWLVRLPWLRELLTSNLLLVVGKR
ncbi:Methyltransferase type 11 [Segniliparus rotundus DSM 44985]|uniref:Methyltransferase type 11 n=1 Tax=Segniliparus rotundus (strain ATCC BAA-972 / CDC 1076 / CIP 108378 / DSM 44985 / JCM 13578) TaxID=640132 RepID=D6ZB34_SEGRD|nr:class I SAM-dependent methyltransferase [Segniliparus rotundus]ADG96793.1 Methyltransferase type 11 [Segniliparus rotundus DSM 44985]